MNAIETMVKHPFATVMIIAFTGSAIANIISAAKGGNVTPVIQVNDTKK